MGKSEGCCVMLMSPSPKLRISRKRFSAEGVRSMRNTSLIKGMKLTGIGIGIGVAGALGLTRVLSSLLFEIKPIDPLTFMTIPLLLASVAVLACWLPARKAARVDPMEALRYE